VCVCVCVCVRMRVCVCVCGVWVSRSIFYYSGLQGGKHEKDALRCRSFSAKMPLIIGFFCGK